MAERGSTISCAGAISRWSSSPKAAWSFCSTVHLLGGLRVLVIENFAWRDGQKQLATLAAAAAAIVAFVFLMRVF